MSTPHPLDPLTSAEIATAQKAVLAAEQFESMPAGARFITVDLREPDKSTLEAWSGERLADVVLLDRKDASTHELAVDLATSTVVDWRRLDDVQPLAVVEELAEAEELVKLDPRVQEALAKRGVTDFDAVQIDAWPAGNFGRPE